MPYDIAISNLGDLILAGNRDLAGITGTALIEQRIRMRLRLHRGAWKYDFEHNLGSQLYTLAGTPAQNAATYCDAYVREALAEMPEITVVEVQSIPTTEDLTLIIVYQEEVTGDDQLIPRDSDLQQLTVSIPVLFQNE